MLSRQYVADNTRRDQKHTKMSSSATKVQRPRLVATCKKGKQKFVQVTFHSAYRFKKKKKKKGRRQLQYIRYSQPVWLECWLIHLPGCFWRWVLGSWTPLRSRCPGPAGYTAGRLKKLLLAAPRLCLRGRIYTQNFSTVRQTPIRKRRLKNPHNALGSGVRPLKEHLNEVSLYLS